MSDQKNNGPESQNDKQFQQDRPQANSTNSGGSSIAKFLEVFLSLPGAAQISEMVTKNFLPIGISGLVGISIGIGTAGKFFPLAPDSANEPAPNNSILIDMNVVCQNPKYYDLKKGTNYQNIKAGEATQLKDDKEKTWPVYRWRCQYQESGDHNTKLAGLDLNLFCQNISPDKKKFHAAYLHYKNPGSWYCVNPG